MPESKLYYAGIVNLDYKILEWPNEAMSFDYFKSISKDLKLVLNDPMRVKKGFIREEDAKYRDEIISIMREIVDNNEPTIYFKSMRYRLVQEWREKNKDRDGQYKVGLSTLYAYIDKYLSGGRQIDLFLPNYSNCGLRGKQKKQGKVKLGRPISRLDSSADFVMTSEAKETIRKAYKLYVKKHGKVGAHELMLQQNYLKRKSKPTLSQFKYWGPILNDPVEFKKSKHGSIVYNKDLKPLKSTVRQDTFGPGSEYMMDSTKDNTYTVSLKFQHKYLGRCTLYLVCDVFSGMVTGFSLTPDNASYYSAALAIYNAGINKEELFKELGINDFTYETWPCDYMPFRILCDRGPEFVSYMSESIPNNLDIELNNTPPYSPHLKSIVERAIRTLLTKIEGKLYGYGLIEKGPKRISKDTRKEAILNYKDIQKIIVLEILKHNNTNPIEGYERTSEMIEDNVPTIPIHLWNWGISKGIGSLRRFKKSELWIKLLPTEKDVTFNKEGYLFKGNRWKNADSKGELIRERLLASKKQGDKVTISYNPTDTKETFLVYKNEFYRLILKSNQASIDNLYELDAEDKLKKETNSAYKEEAKEFKATLTKQQSKVIENAKSRSKKVRGHTPPILKNARETKENEVKDYHKKLNQERNSPSSSLKESEKAEVSSISKLAKLNRSQLLKNKK